MLTDANAIFRVSRAVQLPEFGPITLSRMNSGGMNDNRTASGKSFVGRDDELELISAAVDEAGESRGGLILVGGEAGIGKSTLARAALDMCRERLIPTATGLAWEGGGAPAYWPWTQLIRSILQQRDVPAEIQEKLGDLLPELDARTIGEKNPTLRPDEARFRLMETVRSLLSAISNEQPMVLLLEDLHDADSDSLQLLQFIAPHVAALPLLIIGTFREHEVRSDQARDALWRAARGAKVIRLQPLGEQEIRQYVIAQTGNIPAENRLDRLIRTSEGNPLFLVELVALVGAQKGNSDDPWLPDTVHQAIRQQLEKLPLDANLILEKASILGREFSLQDISALSGVAEDDIADKLTPVTKSQILSMPAANRFRFAHILHCDVLYHELGLSERRALHSKRAQQLSESIDEGEYDQWTAYARHLSLGGGNRMDIVRAWQKAASRARERLAYSDAAGLLENAVAAFGAGPDASTGDRCNLLLELAEATILMGDIPRAQAHASEAYGLAAMLGDPLLMANSALTYGRGFVVASVDPELLRILQESLDVLPESDIGMRARVMARLAAAMQPAADLSVPVAMARKAIELSRSSDDEAVLYDTLRSALAAMMDVAPAQERAELNREYTGLARRLNDVPEQFRGNLRLMIDNLELGDWQGFSNAIDTCDRIAAQINLPHYQWRVAAARALQYQTMGHFDEAAIQIETASSLADIAGDDTSAILIALQKLSLCRDWDADCCSSLDSIQRMLELAYRKFPGAEPFVKPRLACALSERGNFVAAQTVATEEFVRQMYELDDPCSMAMLGEMAATTANQGAARVIYAALEPRKDLCVHAGIMGMTWEGPVTRVLGLLSMCLGKHEQARRYLDDALVVAEKMHARPIIAYINQHLSDVYSAMGDAGKARHHLDIYQSIASHIGLRARRRGAKPIVRKTDAGATFSLTVQGDFWEFEYGDDRGMIKDSKGMQWLSRLIDQPGREFHVLDLVSAGSDSIPEQSESTSGIDDKARNEYRQRVTELRCELEEAESMSDIGRSDELQGELDFLTGELSRAFGIGGRARKSGTSAERARVNVQRRIRDAVKRIGEHSPIAGKYLTKSIKTGSYCQYDPM